MTATDATDTREEGAADAPTSRLEHYLSTLTAMEMPRDRILAQMLNAGFAVEELKPRFPEFPDSAFQPPPARAPRTRTPRVKASPTPAPAARTLQPIKPPAVIEQRAPVPAEVPDPAIEGISFHYVPLIQCSFPHADPGEATSFTRRNGWLELTLGTTKPDVGLPYGVPSRLLTIYCASEAVRTQSPEVYLGKSVHDFLRRLDIPITRGLRGSLSVYANQLMRLVHSTLSIDENIQDSSGRKGLHIRQNLFVEEAKLWWDEGQGITSGSSLLLSGVFFNSILERSAPLSTDAIKRLRKSPMDLDVYAWLAHRLFHLSKPSSITWQQLSMQFGHGYGELRPFRRFFIDSLKRVLKVYPQAQIRVNEGGVLLLPSRPHLPRSVARSSSRSRA